MDESTALRPKAEIGPALRADAARILAAARAAVTDPQRSGVEAVHDFRRAMKEWRALMRLLAPFCAEAEKWRIEGRDHARALAHARDGQAALNALDDLLDHGLTLSARSIRTVRGRIERLRASEEEARFTPELRDAIVAWIDAGAEAVRHWPLDAIDFAALAERLAAGYRQARRHLPTDWTAASPLELHELRRRVVDHRYQMELVRPLWPRFGRMWTGEAERLRQRLGKCQDLTVLESLTAPRQPLARWRARLAPACAERRVALSERAGRIGRRLFAERPKTFRRRLDALWDGSR